MASVYKFVLEEWSCEWNLHYLGIKSEHRYNILIIPLYNLNRLARRLSVISLLEFMRIAVQT